MDLGRKSSRQRKKEASEYEKSLPHYKKKQIIELLSGVLDLPKEKIDQVFDALSDLLTELAFTECVIQIPKFGKFVCKPKNNQRIWNPKEEKTLIYQNPKVVFKLSQKLRSLLRKQYRKNCYQLNELNNMKKEDFKPPQSRS